MVQRRSSKRSGVTFAELTPKTGIEFTGISGSELLDPDVADECLAALYRRGVVIYRDADIDDIELVAFSRMLGDVVSGPIGGDTTHPEIQRFTRYPSQSRFPAYREATFFWHIDGILDEVPNKATLLTARSLSDDGGGHTEFANTVAAYEALSESEKAELDGVRVVHSFAASQLLATPNPSAEERAAWDLIPTREQPLVWTHRSGRKSLVVGATAGEVVGRSPEGGRVLLDRILEHVTQPAFVMRHRWRQGDLVIWDNTSMLHRALPYGASSARQMHRTSLAGEGAIG